MDKEGLEIILDEIGTFLFEINFKENSLKLILPLPKVPTLASMLDIFTFYACEFSLQDERQCISFNNLTPPGFFQKDSSLESP